MNLDITSIITYGVIALLIIILIIVIVSIIKSKRSKNEPSASILDVNLDGVPDSNDRTFNYGYEKEDTIVMNPVEEDNNEIEKK